MPPAPDAAKDRALAILLALVVLGRWDQLKRELRRAASRNMPLEDLREILLQSHLFAGFPRAIEAFETLAAVEAMGVFPLSNGSETAVRSDASAASSGKKLFDTIYGTKSEEVLRRLASFHPKLRDWVLHHAYETVLARPRLSPKQRELAAVAALTVSRQWRQLLSHLRGAMRCGASREEIAGLLRSLKPFSPAPTLAKARRLLDQAG